MLCYAMLWERGLNVDVDACLFLFIFSFFFLRGMLSIFILGHEGIVD